MSTNGNPIESSNGTEALERVTALAVPEEINPLSINSAEVDKLRDRVAAQREMLKVVLSDQRTLDWTDHDGKPYPSGACMTRALNGFGVYLRNFRVERLDDEQGTLFLARAEAWLGNSFLGEYEGGRRAEGYVADLLNARKASVENLRSRGGRTLLSLNGATWEDLARYGVRKDRAGKIEYQSRKGKTADGQTEWVTPFALSKSGIEKGVPIAQLKDETLRVYAEFAKKALADPDKSKWHGREQAWLDALRAEAERRKSAPVKAAGTTPETVAAPAAAGPAAADPGAEG